MEKSLEVIRKWLRQSRLKINDTKWMCLFYKHDAAPVAHKTGEFMFPKLGEY
jgi:hypothetical protein